MPPRTGIVTAATREAGAATRFGATAAGVPAVPRARGAGHLDHSAPLLRVERLSGRKNELPAGE
ncbi:hypothetical protein [Streptomyces tremellae]|uniref:Uncharacterized protein n=1 Tax=Streptomyces tremellae TaxID=1124239 RepID=A0ABP7DQN1_9ACTN